MDFLKVKNWEEYQHYKDRNPPWIKLHAKILNDRDFTALASASRGLLMQLWILASEYGGKVPDDLEEIRFRLRDHTIKEKDVKLLIDNGFLKSCKQAQADASACTSETETETETETEEDAGASDCSWRPKELVDLWNLEMAPFRIQKVKGWGKERQKHLNARIKENRERESLQWWNGLFKYIKSTNGNGKHCNPFLMGMVDPRPGYKRFFVTLPWLIESEENLLKVIEGNYHDGEEKYE